MSIIKYNKYDSWNKITLFNKYFFRWKFGVDNTIRVPVELTFKKNDGTLVTFKAKKITGRKTKAKQ